MVLGSGLRVKNLGFRTSGCLNPKPHPTSWFPKSQHLEGRELSKHINNEDCWGTTCLLGVTSYKYAD